MQHTTNLSDAMRDVIDPVYQGVGEIIEERFNICYREITVVCGPDIRRDTKAAYTKSLALLGSGEFGKALVINAGCTSRRALTWAREVDRDRIGDQPTKHDVVVMTAVGGTLCKYIDEIEAMIDRHGYDILMINSWEFTSMHPRYKDQLLFALQRLIEEYRLTVVIFSHMKGSTVDVGRIQRGTLGKLSVIASKIVSLELEEELAEAKAIVEKPEALMPPVPARSERFVGHDGSVDLSQLHPEEHERTVTEGVLEEELLEEVGV